LSTNTRSVAISASPEGLTYDPAGLTCELTVTVEPHATPTLSISCLPGGIATLSGTTLTISGAGTITVTARVAADGSYDEATETLDVIVAKATQTISFTVQSSVGQGELFDATMSASSDLAVTVTSDAPSIIAAASSSLTAGSVGTATLTATQAGDANYLAAT